MVAKICSILVFIVSVFIGATAGTRFGILFTQAPGWDGNLAVTLVFAAICVGLTYAGLRLGKWRNRQRVVGVLLILGGVFCFLLAGSTRNITPIQEDYATIASMLAVVSGVAVLILAKKRSSVVLGALLILNGCICFLFSGAAGSYFELIQADHADIASLLAVVAGIAILFLKRK